MDVKIIAISDNSSFSLAGRTLSDFSEVLKPYSLGFKEALILSHNDKEGINKAVTSMSADGSSVIVLGGMKEDSFLAQETASSVFGKELVRNKDALDLMNLVYDSVKKQFSPGHEKAGYFPENSFIVPNQNSGISGFYITEPVFFAAIPLERENSINMFKNHILGKMLQKMGINYFVRLRKYKFFGLKEKEFEKGAARLSEIFKYGLYHENSFGETILGVYVNGVSTHKLNENIKSADSSVSEIFGGYLYGYDGDELHSVCAGLLKEKGFTVAIAESLTGGFISDHLTDVPGASAYFIYGGVVYSNFSKTEILGVDKATIEKEGAVSEKAAMEMATGVRKKASSDIGVAVTGFAGPKTPSDNHPVGTVFIALSTARIEEVRKYIFYGSRRDIKTYTSKMALFWIYKLLSKVPASSIK